MHINYAHPNKSQLNSELTITHSSVLGKIHSYQITMLKLKCKWKLQPCVEQLEKYANFISPKQLQNILNISCGLTFGVTIRWAQFAGSIDLKVKLLQ